jgi:hypothetical protein
LIGRLFFIQKHRPIWKAPGPASPVPRPDIDRRPDKHQLANEYRPVREQFMHRHRTVIVLSYGDRSAWVCCNYSFRFLWLPNNESVNSFGLNMNFMVGQERLRR